MPHSDGMWSDCCRRWKQSVYSGLQSLRPDENESPSRQDSEDAFIVPAQRFAPNEAFQGFDAQRELQAGQGPLRAEVVGAQHL
jgi:hypothetical protein